MCTYKKNIVYIGFLTICDFRHLLESWNVSPGDKQYNMKNTRN